MDQYSPPAEYLPSPPAHAPMTLNLLRTARRRTALVAVAVVGAELCAVAAAIAAPGVMGLRVEGQLNVGLVLVLVQLVVAVSAMVWYGLYAKESLDPLTASYVAASRPRGTRSGRPESLR
jgi:CHASE2 domain-containing sensor protein